MLAPPPAPDFWSEFQFPGSVFRTSPVFWSQPPPNFPNFRNRPLLETRRSSAPAPQTASGPAPPALAPQGVKRNSISHRWRHRHKPAGYTSAAAPQTTCGAIHQSAPTHQNRPVVLTSDVLADAWASLVSTALRQSSNCAHFLERSSDHGFPTTSYELKSDQNRESARRSALRL